MLFEDEEEQFQNVALHKEVGTLDRLGTEVAAGFQGQEMFSLIKMGTVGLQSVFNPGDPLTAEQANIAFPDMEKPFDKPISTGAAAALSHFQTQDRARQERLSLTQPGAFNSATGFVANLVGAAADPIGLAMGRGLDKVGAKLMVKGFGKAALTTKLGSVATSGVSGAIGNVVSEAGIVTLDNTIMQRDRNVAEALTMAAVTGMLLPVAFESIGLGASSIGNLYKSKKTRNAILNNLEDMDRRINNGIDLDKTELEQKALNDPESITPEEKATLEADAKTAHETGSNSRERDLDAEEANAKIDTKEPEPLASEEVEIALEEVNLKESKFKEVEPVKGTMETKAEKTSKADAPEAKEEVPEILTLEEATSPEGLEVAAAKRKLRAEARKKMSPEAAGVDRAMESMEAIETHIDEIIDNHVNCVGL